MYIYLNVCKQIFDIQLLLLLSNTWNHLTVCKKKKRAQIHLKMLSTKYVYESYIFNIYVWRGFGIKQSTIVDMP